LKALSQQEGVTLFMTLLGAFKVLLHRYAGQRDVVIGIPIAGRTELQTESLIGFFVNTLVLRTDLSGDPTFRELLSRVREVALGAYAHQDLPFEVLVEALQPERDLNHSPLVQVTFALQNAPRGKSRRGRASLGHHPVGVDSGTAKFDLTLIFAERRDGLSAQLTYNTDLFESSTISRMLGHLETLLRSVVEQPDARISNLVMLTESERMEQARKKMERKDSNFKKLMKTKAKAVALSRDL